MIDFHTHVLPGMDDGAKTATESLRMLSEAYRQGVRLCAATPHFVLHKNGDIAAFLKKRQTRYAELMAAVGGISIPEIRLGAEVYMDNNINSYSGIEKLCIEGTSCMLVEFPVDKYDPYWGDWLHSLSLKGITPMVAHFDRYMYRAEMLADFAGVAVVYQINASRMFSFLGRRLLATLLERHVPLVMASDMHNTTKRACNMQEAFQKGKQKFPKDAVMLFSGAARELFIGGGRQDG